MAGGKQSRTENEHYVARCYLRQFADDQERVYAFDKKTGRSFCTSTRNIASEMHFYDLPRDALPQGVSSQVVEKHFCALESEFAEILRGVIDALEEGHRLPSDIKEYMAPHLALQILRTVEFRTQMTQIGDIVSRMARLHGSPEQVPDMDHPALDHARFMFHEPILQSFILSLTGHMWVAGQNVTSHPLYTSDSPIVRHAHLQNALTPNTGFASPGIEIAFPLSPKYVVMLCERSYFEGRIPGEFKMCYLDENHVKFYNSLQVIESYQRVICSQDSFEHARSVASQNPDHCDPQRERFSHNRLSPEGGRDALY